MDAMTDIACYLHSFELPISERGLRMKPRLVQPSCYAACAEC